MTLMRVSTATPPRWWKAVPSSQKDLIRRTKKADFFFFKDTEKQICEFFVCMIHDLHATLYSFVPKLSTPAVQETSSNICIQG